MCVFGINASHPWDYRIYDFRLSSFKRDSFARGHSKSATVLKTMAFTSDLGEILKETGIPDHLTCLLRNLYAGQEATVRTGHGTTDWFQIGKRVRQGCILWPCLFNFYAEYIMRNTGLEEAQAGIKIARRNINNLRYTDDTILMAKTEEEEPLDEGERGEWKSWL